MNLKCSGKYFMVASKRKEQILTCSVFFPFTGGIQVEYARTNCIELIPLSLNCVGMLLYTQERVFFFEV